VFISYSWTTPEYEERVIALATALLHDGVDVVLDEWDLEEGQDAHAYMERSVNDPTIDRVLLLSDPRYAERADGRVGGDGTEAQVISPQVYAAVGPAP